MTESFHGIRKHHKKQGGFSRSVLRRRRYLEKAKLAQEELKEFYSGEPSVSFFPKGTEVVIFRSKGKPRKKIITQVHEEEDIATAEDIAARLREQDERYVWNFRLAGHPGNLPMAQRRYGLRRRDSIRELIGDTNLFSGAKPSLSSGKLS